MRLKDNQYEDIKLAVIDSFTEYDIKCVPISGFEMATKMGIKIIPYSVLNEEKKQAAMSVSSDGFSVETTTNNWTIYYNDECNNYGRINQTIMHELGHYVLGHIDEGKEEEAEAVFFAKYALAPPPLIHNMDKPIDVENIMKTFDISYQAAVIALGYYNNWLKYGNIEYTDYELKLLELFQVA